MLRHKQSFSIVLLVVGVLGLATLACSSDQEWIIPRTETPTPTHTPVPIEQETLYEIGQPLHVLDTGNPFIFQTNNPEPDNGNNRVIGGPCFPRQAVEVLTVAIGPEGGVFYQVHCVLDGWLAEELLEPLE